MYYSVDKIQPTAGDNNSTTTKNVRDGKYPRIILLLFVPIYFGKMLSNDIVKHRHNTTHNDIFVNESFITNTHIRARNGSIFGFIDHGYNMQNILWQKELIIIKMRHRHINDIRNSYAYVAQT